ncbi:MAG TPA: GNAT family N-acetyltransferase [Acidimicrobiales bacterium]|nr:GNAT family N-acetyltransferase [Acidimicrobiales bacterium]
MEADHGSLARLGGCAACGSEPTWLAEEKSRIYTLRDGSRLLVRPLLASDRASLGIGYEQMSEGSRRRRFFAAGAHLSERELDYLLDLDYDDRYAFAAFALDDDGAPGVGVARYIRDREDPGLAEIAATVLDEYQGRGIGTRLVTELAAEATQHGIATFVAHVLWENEPALELLRDAGARVAPEEPGIARIELDLPEDRAEVEARVAEMLTRITPHLGARARDLT